MAVKRLIDVSFWEDSRILDRFSIEDRYFYLYLLTNPNTTQLGIYHLPIKTISDKTGFTREVVLTLLERFEKVLSVIKYNYETQEISLIESLRFSIIKGGAAVASLLQRELSNVQDTSLIAITLEYNRRFFDISSREFDRKVRDLLTNELVIRQKYLQNPQEVTAQIHNENEEEKEKQKEKQIQNQKPNERQNQNLSIIQRVSQDPYAFRQEVIDNPEIPLDSDLIQPFLDFCRLKQLQFNRSQLKSYNDFLNHMPFDMVREAVLRSMDKQDIFSYSMKILWNWKKLGLTSLFHVGEYEEKEYDPSFVNPVPRDYSQIISESLPMIKFN